MNKLNFLIVTLLLFFSCSMANKKKAQANSTETIKAAGASTELTEKRFWKLMADIGEMGKFIVAVPNQGASANIVGKFSVEFEGTENVFEKKGCSDHVHLSFNQLEKITFSYIDVGYGLEPLMEFQDSNEITFLKLYYPGANATKKQQQLVEKSVDIQTLFKGNW